MAELMATNSVKNLLLSTYLLCTLTGGFARRYIPSTISMQKIKASMLWITAARFEKKPRRKLSIIAVVIRSPVMLMLQKSPIKQNNVIKKPSRIGKHRKPIKNIRI